MNDIPYKVQQALKFEEQQEKKASDKHEVNNWNLSERVPERQLENQGMGNGVGMGIVNLCKKLHAAWAETRRLLVKILFTKLSRDDLGLMTILYTIKGAWPLSFIYNSVLWTLSWIHMPTLTKHWYCNCSSLTSPMTLGDPNPTDTRQIPAVKIESLLGETFMEDTLMQ